MEKEKHSFLPVGNSPSRDAVLRNDEDKGPREVAEGVPKMLRFYRTNAITKYLVSDEHFQNISTLHKSLDGGPIKSTSEEDKNQITAL